MKSKAKFAGLAALVIGVMSAVFAAVGGGRGDFSIVMGVIIAVVCGAFLLLLALLIRPEKAFKVTACILAALAVAFVACMEIPDYSDDTESTVQTVEPTAEPTAEPTPMPTEAPTAEPTAEPTEAPAESSEAFEYAAITLKAGERGEYGDLVTLNAGTEFELTYYAYHVPAGTWYVTNLRKNMDQISIYSDETHVTEEGFEEPADASAYLLDAGETKEITIEDGYYIKIVEPTVVMLTNWQ